MTATTPNTLWVLAKGTTGQTLATVNRQRFEYTGAIQTFRVPDDVTEITIECAGSAGSLEKAVLSERAGGAIIFATFPVVPGALYDVYVGGWSTGGNSAAGGWPDGGAGDAVAGATGVGGGGSSRVIPQGLTLIAALIVAGGGGGSGQQFTGARQCGGIGGLFHGGNAVASPDVLGGLFPGLGGTQEAGGASVAGAGAGGFGLGGNGADATNAFNFPPGGGGGGWYGGSGGGTNNLSGAGNSGGGGGGSGWVAPTGFDILNTDGGNQPAQGYVEFTWETPIV